MGFWSKSSPEQKQLIENLKKRKRKRKPTHTHTHTPSVRFSGLLARARTNKQNPIKAKGRAYILLVLSVVLYNSSWERRVLNPSRLNSIRRGMSLEESWVYSWQNAIYGHEEYRWSMETRNPTIGKPESGAQNLGAGWGQFLTHSIHLLSLLLEKLKRTPKKKQNWLLLSYGLFKHV